MLTTTAPLFSAPDFAEIAGSHIQDASELPQIGSHLAAKELAVTYKSLRELVALVPAERQNDAEHVEDQIRSAVFTVMWAVQRSGVRCGALLEQLRREIVDRECLCQACGGLGDRDGEPCRTCKGQGVVR